jgi:hypothetical protein
MSIRGCTPERHSKPPSAFKSVLQHALGKAKLVNPQYHAFTDESMSAFFLSPLLVKERPSLVRISKSKAAAPLQVPISSVQIIHATTTPAAALMRTPPLPSAPAAAAAWVPKVSALFPSHPIHWPKEGAPPPDFLLSDESIREIAAGSTSRKAIRTRTSHYRSCKLPSLAA